MNAQITGEIPRIDGGQLRREQESSREEQA